MFGRSSSRATERPPVPSIVGADLQVSGDMASDGEIQVEGGVTGDVRCRVIVVGQGGAVTGAIEAERAVVRGGVTGRITARTVELAKTARIVGDIVHDRLEIEAGAEVEGHLRRLSPSAALASAQTLIVDQRAEPAVDRPVVIEGAVSR